MVAGHGATTRASRCVVRDTALSPLVLNQSLLNGSGAAPLIGGPMVGRRPVEVGVSAESVADAEVEGASERRGATAQTSKRGRARRPGRQC